MLLTINKIQIINTKKIIIIYLYFCYKTTIINNENMTNIIEVENKIICLRDQQVILNADVAELYGVQTKEINQAVKK